MTEQNTPFPQPKDLQREARFHVHHSFIWLGSLQASFTLLIVVAVSAVSGISGSLSRGEAAGASGVPILAALGVGGIVAVVVVVGIIVLVQWLSYKNLYYELGSEEFNLYSGILNKKRVHVPYHRIQSVNQKATLIQRIFGVCTVHVDTAGGSANKAIVVPYLQNTQAERLRSELFARKQQAVAVQVGNSSNQTAPIEWSMGDPETSAAFQQVTSYPGPSAGSQNANVLDMPAEIIQDVRGVFGSAAFGESEPSYEYGLGNKELVLTGLSNNTAFVLIVLGVLGAVAQFAGQVAPLMTGMLEPVVGNVVAAGVRLFGGNAIAAGITVFVVVMLIIWLFSIIGTCISYGGFKARRRDSRIEIERGLLQHHFQGVDVDRVQSVIVKQSFIRRMIGYCELSLGKIDAAVEGAEEQQAGLSQGLVIHPFVKMSRVPEILAGLVPEFADVPVENTRVAPVARRRAITRRCIVQGEGFWLAVVVAIIQIGVNVFVPLTGDGATVVFFVNTGAFVGYALCLVLLILDAVGAILWFRESGFAFNSGFMQVSNGGLSRETVSFPRKKIQYGFTKTNPLQRMAGTVTVNARTAAGIGGTTVRLIDVREEDARAWLEWLQPRENMVR